MRPLLLRSLYWLAGVGAAAALAALLFGWAIGLALALLAALIGLGFHLYYLDKLLAWLDNPAPERTPEGMGGWQDVFSALYRQSRQQTMAQKKLSSALERFINAGEAMPDGVVVLDEHDRIEWLNPMAVDHFQLDRKRDVGNMVANLVRQPGFHDYLLAQNYSQPLILRLSQPVEQVLAVQLVPFDSTRKLLISRDITQLDRVQTVHRDFVANVSHELRTPLTVIGGFLETLADMDAPEPDVTRQFLPMMMEQAKRMQSLVEDLLTLSRLENGSKTASQEKVDMTALLNTLRVEAEGLSQGRHQIILGDCDAANLWGNANELHSAFGNLVSNAVRYTPEGGRIRLDWRLDKGRGVFSVSDTGIGIAPQHIPRLTERFYRVDRGRSRGTGGTGLGLAIVKHVLARHHARLDVHSELERGSTFSVWFNADHLAPTA
ncbi:phosphate regulon sensor histidine kinase PhoR [Rivihabitans pingtungensis]|uniref:phosphate regulon sensor histidine kinase PhoR n=1 Tax=Rivihabitans pingtungensis TaxID=1054498 RepID=UPI002FDA9CBA